MMRKFSLSKWAEREGVSRMTAWRMATSASLPGVKPTPATARTTAYEEILATPTRVGLIDGRLMPPRSPDDGSRSRRW
jgi:hypothetical protein